MEANDEEGTTTRDGPRGVADHRNREHEDQCGIYQRLLLQRDSLEAGEDSGIDRSHREKVLRGTEETVGAFPPVIIIEIWVSNVDFVLPLLASYG
jgi:hypothetical protein